MGEPGSCLKTKKTQIFCFFKNGNKQKGPQMRVNIIEMTIEFRSQTFTAQENSFYMKAWIDSEGNQKTGYFVNDKLDREVDYIDSYLIDMVIP